MGTVLSAVAALGMVAYSAFGIAGLWHLARRKDLAGQERAFRLFGMATLAGLMTLGCYAAADSWGAVAAQALWTGVMANATYVAGKECDKPRNASH